MKIEDSGPPFLKLGSGRHGSVRYPEKELHAWLKARTVGSVNTNDQILGNRYLKENEVAEITGLSTSWLRRKRWEAVKQMKTEF